MVVNVIMILISTFLARIGFGELLLIISYHLSALETPATFAGIAMAANPIAELSMAIPAGYISDKIGRKRVFIGGL